MSTKDKLKRWERHGTSGRDTAEHRCAVCGDKVVWLSRLDLGQGKSAIALCPKHQATFGLDYPPQPPYS